MGLQELKQGHSQFEDTGYSFWGVCGIGNVHDADDDIDGTIGNAHDLDGGIDEVALSFSSGCR